MQVNPDIFIAKLDAETRPEESGQAHIFFAPFHFKIVLVSINIKIMFASFSYLVWQVSVGSPGYIEKVTGTVPGPLAELVIARLEVRGFVVKSTPVAKGGSSSLCAELC